MATLLSLSAELKLSIVEHLDNASTAYIPGPSADLLNLSCVCRVLRAITAPSLFKNLTLLNDEKSGSSVLAVLDSPWTEFVQSLHYIGIMLMPSYDVVEEDGPRLAPSVEDLPSSTEQVLSTLARLPKLERVVVEFRCAKTQKEEEDIHADTFDNMEESENNADVLAAESKDAYRSLMKRSYDALGQNPESTIEELELKNILAKDCSSWESEKFRTLLHGLSSFAMSLRGGDNGAGWQINMVPAYLAFIESLDGKFFEHLHNVKHLRFSATTDGPPGLEGGMNNAALPLHEHQLTQLTSLELNHVFISNSLATFIAEHSHTLERVLLRDCYSGSDENNCTEEGVAMAWGEFFSAIADSESLTLRTFEIAPSFLETVQVPKPGSYRHSLATSARELREKFPERRMLDYKHVDDKYGMLFDSDLGIERFEEAADQEGWEKLCAFLERNNSG